MDDGIKVYYREYGSNESDKTPVLCIPGLSRSSLSFHNIASELSKDRRVLCVDLRGRGKSDYDENYKNYNPGQYVKDVVTLLKSAGVDKVVIIGTSLGGVIAMTGAPTFGDTLAGVVMNDVGPNIERAGIERIEGYAGKTRPPENWDDAVVLCKEMTGVAFPDYTEEQWQAFAHTIYGAGDDGGPVDWFDRDISKNFVGPVAGDMWSLYEQLYHIPVAVLWGDISDILSENTAKEMARQHPDAALTKVPGVGHTPSLDEPESRAGIQKLLEKVDQ